MYLSMNMEGEIIHKPTNTKQTKTKPTKQTKTQRSCERPVSFGPKAGAFGVFVRERVLHSLLLHIFAYLCSCTVMLTCIFCLAYLCIHRCIPVASTLLCRCIYLEIHRCNYTCMYLCSNGRMYICVYRLHLLLILCIDMCIYCCFTNLQHKHM